MLCCKKDDADSGLERVFGAKIMKMRDDDLGAEGVPRILRQCATFLRENGLGTQGIFRRPGNAVKMKELKALSNQGQNVDLAKLGGIHQAANAMKTFFRDLREPLLTHELYKRILRFQPANQAEGEREMRNLILSIPPRHLTVLRALVMFLMEVVEQSDKNSMTVSNVAIVFSPNLCWAKGAGPNSGKISSVTDMKSVRDFTEFMLQNCGSIFAGLVMDGYTETTL